MTITARLLGASALVATIALAAPASAGTIFTDRTAFAAELTSSATDGYDAANYGSGFSQRNDAAMSAVFGETRYTDTAYGGGFNFISGGRYCVGCNGSFVLTFDQTSFGGPTGVFGAGLDYSNFSLVHSAFVTYGDGSTQNVTLDQLGFFGVTSTAGVYSIAFGLPNGQITRSGSLTIDNLTIGTGAIAGGVPEPMSWAMLVLGFGTIGGALRRRPRVSTTVRFA